MPRRRTDPSPYQNLTPLRKWILRLPKLRETREKNIVSSTLVLGWLVVALAASFVSPADPYMLTNDRLISPNRQHLLGTDTFGRDLLSQIIWGSRVSLLFGLGVTGLSFVLGVVIGAIPGYYGGIVDDLVSRFIEIVLVIPPLMVIILAAAVFGSRVSVAIVIVAMALWPANARIMRGQVLQLRAREYVMAAQSFGGSDWHVLFRHIVPNALPPVVANATLQMGSAVIIEASLSFLGLGDPNHISWGQILYRGQFARSAWWLSVSSGAAIASVVLGFNLLGDTLNDILNPRLRR